MAQTFDATVGRANSKKKVCASLANYRVQAMITYAYNVHTREVYVGYSGSSGGMVDRRGELAEHDMAYRRHERIRRVIEAYRNRYATDREPYNCGEAAAYSIAVSWHERLSDLAFASFGLQDELVDPCPNCRLWLEGAYGYYVQPSNWYES
jgi:hypothetical protein